MANVFLISDQHYGHSNILNFFRSDGVTKLRPFTHVDEMDEHMVECHNSVVRPGDKVYIIGDICMSHKSLPVLNRLNGEKCLIKGNHDKAKLSQYLPYFYDIRGSHQFDGIIMSHIPIHPDSLARWPTCVHGHLHYNRVMRSPHHIDPRYFNVSVECIDYTPISLEELKLEIKKQS